MIELLALVICLCYLFTSVSTLSMNKLDLIIWQKCKYREVFYEADHRDQMSYAIWTILDKRIISGTKKCDINMYIKNFKWVIS